MLFGFRQYLEKVMKKVLLVVMLMLTTVMASAQWHHHHDGYCSYRGGYGGGWIGPAIIGGVIGYELSRPSPVYTQPPVIIEQQPVVVQQSVIQQPPIGYHWQEMIDPQTNIRKIVLVPN